MMPSTPGEDTDAALCVDQQGPEAWWAGARGGPLPSGSLALTPQCSEGPTCAGWGPGD